jgi:hypothetical protein
MGLRYRKGITREPRDTESGHAWFGGGPLEKYPYGQLAGSLSYFMSGSEERVGRRTERQRALLLSYGGGDGLGSGRVDYSGSHSITM